MRSNELAEQVDIYEQVHLEPRAVPIGLNEIAGHVGYEAVRESVKVISEEHDPSQVYAYDKPLSSNTTKYADHDILTHNEVVKLAKRIEKGDLEAKDTLILNNMKLILKYVNDLRIAEPDKDDAIHDCTTGLIRAAEKYDYRLGFRFSTYAMTWIRQSLQRSNDNTSNTIRIPSHLVRKIEKLGKTYKELTHKNGFEPTDEDIALAMGVSLEKLAEIQYAASISVASYDIQIDTGDGEGSPILSLLESTGPSVEDEAENLLQRDSLHALLVRLPSEQAKIVAMRHGLYVGWEMNNKEIAKTLGISGRTVAKYYSMGMETLQSIVEEEKISF